MLVVLLEQATESSLVPRPEKRAWYTLSAHSVHKILVHRIFL